MNITRLELAARDLQEQHEYYANVLAMPVSLTTGKMEVRAGRTDLIFTQAETDFDGAYHFAFNIPKNQFGAAKEWIASRQPLLHDVEGKDEFTSKTWNSQSVYFKDPAGNVLEFIARHALDNEVDEEFDARKILNVSEIGLPSENVVGFANGLCQTLGISPYKQEPSETFTPVGDENGLLILPIKDRIWYPNTGVPARLLPVKVTVEVKGKGWEIRGMPYELIG
jgi:catechol-2,3-dioxygenase